MMRNATTTLALIAGLVLGCFLAFTVKPGSAEAQGRSNNTGDVQLTTFGSSPNAQGATLTGQTINLEPASPTQPGCIQVGGVQGLGVSLRIDGGVQVAGKLGVDGGELLNGDFSSNGGVAWCTASGFNTGCNADFYWQGGRLIQGASGTAMRLLGGAAATTLAYFANNLDSSKAFVDNDGGFYDLTGAQAMMGSNPATPGCEYAEDAGVSGALSFTFSKAFTAPPGCFCSDLNATTPLGCGVKSRSASGVTVALTTATGTDTIMLMCCGPRR